MLSLNNGFSSCVACVYAPNRNLGRDDFYEFCASKIDLSVPTLICGDFNAVFDRSLDRHGSDVSDTKQQSFVLLLTRGAVCTLLLWPTLFSSLMARFLRVST